ncbi:glycoside hydrolase family 18 protein [Glaciimonas immobilis]|uniref:chitinase n=1 Tax=Glaciimonas immobilis TaxID=728004 RepID=A0A840RTS4_9BURK|nr:glycosyl hydrolase family 18 protein [Glaciimonas immobilis]KAF3997092.1 hypothetical protein HAV38_15620 [Glaciimonas immobilis]MBB5199950.1 GH18 family chitinase [Glaciimonas immobilis]
MKKRKFLPAIGFTAFPILLMLSGQTLAAPPKIDQLEAVNSSVNNAKIRTVTNWAPLADSVCWYKGAAATDSAILGCQSTAAGNMDIEMTAAEAWGSAAYYVNWTIPESSLNVGNNTLTAKLCKGGECATKTETISFDAGTPVVSFDYANSVTGLTHKAVVPNKEGFLGTEPVSSRDENFVVGGYVSEWAQYGRKFDVEKLDASSYTNLVYAFVGICGDTGEKHATVSKACTELERKDFEITPLDVWGGFQSAISKRQADYPWDEYAYSGILKKNYDGLNRYNVRGMMGQLLHLKEQNKDLKIAVSVGGWTLSTPFPVLAANSEKRKVFIDSVVSFVYKWQLDEVDLDWEFPKSEEEGRNFAILVEELKVALEAGVAQPVTISSAVGATEQYINNVGHANYARLARSLDKIYLMNYDFWGAWSGDLGHQTNLSGPSDAQFSAQKAIKLLEEYGVPKKKIILGVANYSRGKKGEIQRPGEPASAINVSADQVFGTHEATVLEGFDLFANIAGENLKGKNNFSLFTDKKYDADYYYNPTSQVYFSIDTPRTAYRKAQYAKEMGLGGVFSWSVEQDHLGYSVNAMNEGLGNKLEDKFTSVQEREALYATCGINLTAQECASIGKDPIFEIHASHSTVTAVTSVKLSVDVSNALASDFKFGWTQITGDPKLTINSHASQMANVLIPAVNKKTTFEFEVEMAHQKTGLKHKKTIKVIAQPGTPPAINVIIESYRQVFTVGNIVTLKGQKSSSADGSALTYLWTQLSGPQQNLDYANRKSKRNLEFDLRDIKADTKLKFKLTVKNKAGLTATDEIEIIGTPVAVKNPVAVATAKFSSNVDSGFDTLVLDGTNSKNTTMAGKLTYSWRQISGPMLDFRGYEKDGAANLMFRPFDKNTQFGFELTVTNTYGLKASTKIYPTAKPRQM